MKHESRSETLTPSRSNDAFRDQLCVSDRCAHRGQPLQGGEALLPGGGGLLEGLVAFDELLHLVHTLAHLPAGQVGLLAQQPGLRYTRVPGELVHLQDWGGQTGDMNPDMQSRNSASCRLSKKLSQRR